MSLPYVPWLVCPTLEPTDTCQEHYFKFTQKREGEEERERERQRERQRETKRETERERAKEEKRYRKRERERGGGQQTSFISDSFLRSFFSVSVAKVCMYRYRYMAYTYMCTLTHTHSYISNNMSIHTCTTLNKHKYLIQ